MTDRRVRLVRVNLQTYLDLMKRANSTVEFTGDFLPEDAQVLDVGLVMVVHSEQFAPIPDWEPIPMMREPTFKVEEWKE